MTVVDASVAVKWFLDEDYSEPARSLLVEANALWVPDLLFVEVANVLWKRVRTGELGQDIAQDFMRDLTHLTLEIAPTVELVEDALTVACLSGRTAYDALYLVLAMRQKTALVTGDEKLRNGLKGSLYEPFVQWIGEPRP
jgi:predicted nucleic acid-binding protein